MRVCVFGYVYKNTYVHVDFCDCGEYWSVRLFKSESKILELDFFSFWIFTEIIHLKPFSFYNDGKYNLNILNKTKLNSQV